MRVRAGTSGYAYKEWRGSFYPADLREAHFLAHYATRLPSVEINNTFYRMPRKSVVSGWCEKAPPDFVFVLKASRRITHQKRLRDAADSVTYLFEVAEAFGDRLGPVLFQLPPQLPRDVALLRDFLAVLPPGRRSAFEFRHQSWLVDEVYSTLAEHGAALCCSDQLDGGLSLVATADFGYLRLRGANYSAGDLDAIAAALGEKPWREAFAFFKHEELGPALALALNERCQSGEPLPLRKAAGEDPAPEGTGQDHAAGRKAG